MLGFSTYSETPCAQSVASTDALAFLPSAILTLTKNDVITDAKANTTPVAVTASFDLGIGYDAKANLVMPSANSNLDLYNLTDVDAQAKTTPTAVTATTSIEGFADVDAQARVYNLKVSSVARAYSVDFNADANKTIVSVSANHNIADFEEVIGITNVRMPDIEVALNQSPVSPVGIMFDFDAIKDSYDRNRVIIIEGYDTNRTVHVEPENRFIYILPDNINRTVHIVPETRIVFMERQNTDRTVYIRA